MRASEVLSILLITVDDIRAKLGSLISHQQQDHGTHRYPSLLTAGLTFDTISHIERDFQHWLR